MISDVVWTEVQGNEWWCWQGCLALPRSATRCFREQCRFRWFFQVYMYSLKELRRIPRRTWGSVHGLMISEAAWPCNCVCHSVCPLKVFPPSFGIRCYSPPRVTVRCVTLLRYTRRGWVKTWWTSGPRPETTHPQGYTTPSCPTFHTMSRIIFLPGTWLIELVVMRRILVFVL